MIPILSTEPAEITDAVTTVVRRAVAGGAPECKLLVIADQDGQWLRHFASLNRHERAQGVVAVRTASQLVCAQRLRIGGAFWLPPSVGSVSAALEAAGSLPAGANSTCLGDAEALQTCTDREFHLVTVEDREFWLEQMGEGQLRLLLGMLAGRLGLPTVVLPWPALLIAELDQPALDREWSVLTSEGCLPGAPIVVDPDSSSARWRDPIHAAFRALAQRDGIESQRALLRPVHRLPSGERLGSWASAPPSDLPENGWAASPEGQTDAGFSWKLEVQDGEAAVVPDIVDPDEVSRAPGPAVRIPPWATARLVPGSVAQQLVDAVAREAEREGKAVWLSRVCNRTLSQVLRKSGEWWVDGRAVPG